MAVNEFSGTAGVVVTEESFRMEDLARKEAIPSTLRPAAVELELINTDAANSLDYSLDEQITWTALPAGASFLRRGRISNARNSIFIRRTGAADATYAGTAIT